MARGDFDVLMARFLSKGKGFHGFSHILRGDILACETYGDYKKEALHPMYSVTKTIAVLMGLHCAAAHNRGLDERFGPWAGVTVYHLMNMLTGIEWEEVARFNQPDNPFKKWLDAEDAMVHLEALPFAAPPGRSYNYNSAASHVLAYWIEAVSGESFEDYVVKNLFEPLGIVDYRWEGDRCGQVYGGHGLWLSFDDFIKIGHLFCNRGKYGGGQVMASSLFERICEMTSEGTRGYAGYGFGMWHAAVADRHFVCAFGHGGQRLYWDPTSDEAFLFLGAVLPEFSLQEKLIAALLAP